nr:MAG: hypothetical protein [Usmuvirus newyorkense]
MRCLIKAQPTSMASKIDTFALPLIKLDVYRPPEGLEQKAISIMTGCLPSRPEGVELDRLSFLASYIELYLDRPVDVDLRECGYEVERKTLSITDLSRWKMFFHPVVYPDPLFVVVNNCLLVMLCAKPVNPSGYATWSGHRAKAIFQLYDKPFPPNGSQYLLSFEWAGLVSKWMQRSQLLRVNILTYAIEASHGATQYKRAYLYTVTMLRYARLTPIVLIKLYILSAHTGIMREPYLSADAYCWKLASETLDGFAREIRPYMGILADLDVASVLGGKQLHNLTYIALKVGAQKQKSLQMFAQPTVDDPRALDKLIEKYFPPVPPDVMMLPKELEFEPSLEEPKPLREIFRTQYHMVSQAFQSVEPVQVAEMVQKSRPQRMESKYLTIESGTTEEQPERIIRRELEQTLSEQTDTTGVSAAGSELSGTLTAPSVEEGPSTSRGTGTGNQSASTSRQTEPSV